MNRLMIIGNLVRDPEMRVTQNGKDVCTFTVAVNRRDDTADYFRVTAWEERAKVCGKYLAKGKKVCVVGAVSVSTYQTNAGETRAEMNVTAQEVEFLSPRDYTQVDEADNPFVW